MRYLCLVYSDGKYLESMPQDVMDELVAEHLALGEELEQSGRSLGSDALQPVQTATTVRVRNGKVSITDGPFAETKEQLGGYYLIEARDLNEAVQIAARIPSARFGSIEVRPIWEVRQREKRAGR